MRENLYDCRRTKGGAGVWNQRAIPKGQSGKMEIPYPHHEEGFKQQKGGSPEGVTRGLKFCHQQRMDSSVSQR